MHSFTIAIDRKSLLEEANRIIRDHEDYMHGMLATEVEQKGPVLVFRGEFFLMSREYRRRKPQPSLICSSISPTSCRKNIIW